MKIHTLTLRAGGIGSYDATHRCGAGAGVFEKNSSALWFKEHSDPYKDAELPEAPAELIAELSRRYI